MNTERIIKGKGRKVRFVLDEEGEKWYSAIDVVRAFTDEEDYERSRRYWAKIKKEYFSDEEDDNDIYVNQRGLTASDGKLHMSDVLSHAGIRFVAIYIAITFRTKGLYYINQNDIHKAKDYCERSVYILENILGKSHIETVDSLNTLGRIYGKLGDYDLAIEHFGEDI